MRLTPDEVDRIAAGSAVSATTTFPGGEQFRYELALQGRKPSATFEGGVLRVILPPKQAKAWACSQTLVSIEEEVAGAGFTLLVEKDFECLEPREGESQLNRFRREQFR